MSQNVHYFAIYILLQILKNPNIPGDTVISKVARLMGHPVYYATQKLIIYKTFVEWTFKTLYNNKRVAAVLKISDLEDLRTSPIN